MSIAIWPLMTFTPGDPALRILQTRDILEPTAEQAELLHAEFGLDRPLILRYLDWMTGLVHDNLGPSWATGHPISDGFLSKLPVIVLPIVVAPLPALALAMALGVPAALRALRWPDILSRGFTLVALSLPPFLTGVASVKVITLRPGLGRVLADGTIAAVLLLALVLALGPAATWSRLLHAGLLETRNASSLSVARGRGASRDYLLTRHLLSHAAPPMSTVIKFSAATLLSGTSMVETVPT